MKNSILFHQIFTERWFIWMLVFLLAAGISLISYLQWVDIELDINNMLMIA